MGTAAGVADPAGGQRQGTVQGAGRDGDGGETEPGTKTRRLHIKLVLKVT